MKNELNLQLLSSLNLLSYSLNLSCFFFFLSFFPRALVAVSEAVSHSAVWEMQSVGQLWSSGRPAAVANENSRSIAKKIIASRNRIPSFLCCGRRDAGRNVWAAQRDITGRHLVCELYISPDGRCVASGLSGWRIYGTNTMFNRAHLSSSYVPVLTFLENWLDELKNARTSEREKKTSLFFTCSQKVRFFGGGDERLSSAVLCFPSNWRRKQSSRSRGMKTGGSSCQITHTGGCWENTHSHTFAHPYSHVFTYLTQGHRSGCAAWSSPCISRAHAWLYSARTLRPPGENKQEHVKCHQEYWLHCWEVSQRLWKAFFFFCSASSSCHNINTVISARVKTRLVRWHQKFLYLCCLLLHLLVAFHYGVSTTDHLFCDLHILFGINSVCRMPSLHIRPRDHQLVMHWLLHPRWQAPD